MTVRLPTGSGEHPRYIEIQHALERRILSGEWPPGTRIPSELQLTEQFSCSRMTVNKALSALSAAGLVTRKRRAGTIVASPQAQHAILEIHDIQAEISATGRSHRHEILHRRLGQATPADMARLGLDTPVDVLFLRIRHFSDDEPAVLETRLINLLAVPEAATADFRSSPPGTWLLQQIPWTGAEHRIRAISADADTAAHLDLRKGAACLVIERKTWRNGSPVTWAELIHPGERHELCGKFTPSTR